MFTIPQQYKCQYQPITDTLFSDTLPCPNLSSLSLHAALPISRGLAARVFPGPGAHRPAGRAIRDRAGGRQDRSEEHTSELQSHSELVCRLLLEKKKKVKNNKL